MEQYDYIRTLFARYMDGTITTEEREELSEAAEVYNQKEWEEIVLPLLEATPADPQFSMEGWEDRIHFILQQAPVKKARVIRMAYKWSAAAAIIILVATGSYFAFFSKKSGVGGEQTSVAKTIDVEPPRNTKAVITLADGRTVALDSISNGTLAVQNNVEVIKSGDGKISYRLQGAGYREGEIVYNTLTNPRGSKVIDMMLEDGSHVWLNAGSSVRFPVAFVGSERKVEITGEAYFEVTHDAKKPFIVSKGETSVTVLGTHFNVNAYDDEESLKVTLLEGSVRVKSEVPSTSLRAGSSLKSEKTIKPGEQAILSFPLTSSGQAISVVSGVDLDVVMAWKNGRFSFNRADIRTVMRQFARWYDLDVVYEGQTTNDLFGGDIQRDLPLSKVLDFLEKSQVHFKVDGKRVVVKQ